MEDPPQPATPRPGRSLFLATTFASAFLIFLVQPLVAKRILPWFGGVPSVWSLCLAFYQTALFAGYAYAHGLIRRASAGWQVGIHAAAIAAAAIALPVLPGDAQQPDGSADPSGAILAILFADVALPFTALAATGSLVAVWFARRFPGRSPYPLYAVSNLGSLCALLSYPFALEPRIPLSTTGRLWSLAFAATGAAVIACGVLAWRAHAAPEASADDAAAPPIRVGRLALWILLEASAVVILMGVTNHLCLDLASVPFLWIVPLSLYLVSWIACFGAPRVYRRAPFVALALLAYAAPMLADGLGVREGMIRALGGPVLFQVARHSALVFAACMVLHGELFRLRPPARSLSTFYLCTTGGGALGGLSVGLLAPHVFDDFYELPLGLALGWLALLAACRADERSWLGRAAPPWLWAPTAAATAFALIAGTLQAIEQPDFVVQQQRSFFGVLTVERRSTPDGAMRTLQHGSTRHGLQLESSPRWPTSYYGIHTGIGIALGLRSRGVPSEIGVIGLGIGTLAAYGRPGDRMRFFEIDPAVIALARDQSQFSFLSHSAAVVEIVAGDGRISLARERASGAPRFDFLIVDAYSSDAVPVHLLTREAIALYLASLEPDGLLAVHISSRNFDLLPVLARLASDAGLQVISIESAELPAFASGRSSWVFLARDAARLRVLAETAEHHHRTLQLPPDSPPVRRPTPEMLAAAPLWTDDYSDLVRVLSLTGSRPKPARSPLPGGPHAAHHGSADRGGER